MPYTERARPRPVVVRVSWPPTEDTSTTTTSSSRQVHFAPTSTSSRQLTTQEIWSLYNFEVHSRNCQKCLDPAAVYRAGRRLCDTGNALCADVILHVYRYDDIYYSTKRENSQHVRVEIPGGYGHTQALLKVMEKQRQRQRSPYAAPSRVRADSVMGDSPPAQKASPVRKPDVVVEHSTRESSKRHSARRTSPVETSSGRRSNDRIRQEPDRREISDRRRSNHY